MPKTYIDGRAVKKWYVDSQLVKKAYLDGRLIHRNEFVLYITGHKHDVYDDWVWDHLHASGGGAEQDIRIIVNPGVQLISANTGVRGVFNFHGGWGGRNVIIENHGWIFGRGGNGGMSSSDGWGGYGQPGGRAIYNENANVTIINHGVISGGGGGGGGAMGRTGGGSYCAGGGGGGAPFGAGGVVYGAKYQVAGHPGSITDGGGGVSADTRYHMSGAGGGLGVAGANGWGKANWGYGGAAGEASRGAIHWEVLGDVRGARV